MHHILRAAPVGFILLLLIGCSASRQEEGTRVLERREVPTADGGRVVKETEQTVKTGQTRVESPVDFQAVLGTAVAGLRGDLTGVATNLASALARNETAAHERQRQYEAKVAELTGRLDMMTSKVGSLGESVAGAGARVDQANKAYEDSKREFERKLAEKTAEVIGVSAKTGFSSPEAQGTLAAGALALVTAGGGVLRARRDSKRAQEAEDERLRHEKAARIAAEYADSMEKLAQRAAELPPEDAGRLLEREVVAHKKAVAARQTAAGVLEVTQKIRGRA